jgi:hypothetical protein
MEFRFGGGAGVIDFSLLPSNDIDTREPNTIDVIVAAASRRVRCSTERLRRRSSCQWCHSALAGR